MGFRLSAVARTKQILNRSQTFANQADVPKGYLAVYVGENEKRRFVISISCLNQPPFQELLKRAEEEFGYEHPMGGLTLPCREDIFLQTISWKNGL